MQQCIAKHQGDISGVLSGFDRLVMRGTLRSIAYAQGMNQYLWNDQILLKDFGAHLTKAGRTVTTAILTALRSSVRQLTAALRAQRARTAEQRLQVQLYGEWADHGLVFPNSTGAPLDGTSVYHVFKRLLPRAQLSSTHRVHDLGHSTATYLLAAGVDSRIVMDIMGWSQASMLTRNQHVLPAMLDEAAARLEIALPLAR